MTLNGNGSVTKVATGVVEGLKAQPIVLALIVLNVLFLGVALYVYRDQQTRFGNAYRAMFEHCIAK